MGTPHERLKWEREAASPPFGGFVSNKFSTAYYVTGGRARAYLDGLVDDPFALELVSDSLQVRGLLAYVTSRLIGPRTRTIDDGLSIEPRSFQLVLLGAGYDARAHRLHCLKDSHVWEVDLPSLQARKRDVASAWPLSAKSLTYVPCDVSHDDLKSLLLGAGFQPACRTVWVAEGLWTYLQGTHVASLLETITSLSTPGSTLYGSYNQDSWITRGVSCLTSLLGEPQRFFCPPERMRMLLRARHWEVQEDTSGTDRLKRFSPELTGWEKLWVRHHRLLYAVKRA